MSSFGKRLESVSQEIIQSLRLSSNENKEIKVRVKNLQLYVNSMTRESQNNYGIQKSLDIKTSEDNHSPRMSDHSQIFQNNEVYTDPESDFSNLQRGNIKMTK